MEELNQLFDDAYIASCLYDYCDCCHEEYMFDTLHEIEYRMSGRIGLSCDSDVCRAAIIHMLSEDPLFPAERPYYGLINVGIRIVSEMREEE